MESVVTLPVGLVHDFVEDMQKRQRKRDNTSQFAIASFASSHEGQWTPEQFLPWATEGQKTVATDTLTILRSLVEAGDLNPRAEAAARARLKK